MKEADTGYWELPGGRIDVGEERMAQADVLLRELREELGEGFRVVPQAGVVTWVRYQPEDDVYQMLVVRHCLWVAGEIAISDEHAEHRWTTPDDWPALIFPPLSDYRDGLQRVWGLIA